MTTQSNRQLVREQKLSREFYDRPTLDVARDLIGKQIVYNSPRGRLAARIVEVEAYIGQDDPACHAAVGRTSRNEVMFGPPGHAYIYFIYGMYHCLNFVTEREGFPAAVLLRGAEPIDGLALIKKRAPSQPDHRLLAGPGKFCRAFGLTRDQNGLDLTGKELYLIDSTCDSACIKSSTRIGIQQGVELPFRFFDSNSACVSRN